MIQYFIHLIPHISLHCCKAVLRGLKLLTLRRLSHVDQQEISQLTSVVLTMSQEKKRDKVLSRPLI